MQAHIFTINNLHLKYFKCTKAYSKRPYSGQKKKKKSTVTFSLNKGDCQKYYVATLDK